MNTKELKQLRGQLRQVVKEMLPEILNMALAQHIHKDLATQLEKKLIAIDERQRDLQAYMVRASLPTNNE